MPPLSEVILQVTGNATDARRELAATARDLALLDKSDAAADFQITGLESAQRRLGEMKDELYLLDRTDATAEVDIEVDRALANIALMHNRINELFDQLRTRQQSATEGQSLFDAEKFRAEQAKAVAEVEKTGAQIAAVFARIKAASSTDLRANVTVSASGLTAVQAQMGALQRDLERMSREDVSIDVQVRAASALAQLELLKRKANDLKNSSRGGMIDAKGFSVVAAGVAGLTKIVGGLGEAMGTATTMGTKLASVLGPAVGDAMVAVGSKASVVMGAITALSGKSRDVGQSLMAIGAAIVAAVLPALAALGASLAVAAAGVAGLATAFAAALGPAVLLVVAVITRLTKILAAKKAIEAENKNETNLTAQAERKAAAAEQARHQALVQLRDAQQAIVTSERALGEARRQAAQEIANAVTAEQGAARARVEAVRELGNADRAVTAARKAAAQERIQAAQKEADAERALANARRQAARSIADAQRQVADAATRVKEAAQDAYQAMADAAMKAREAVLALADAQLGVEEAQLRLEEAQLAVAEAMTESAQAVQQARREFEQFDRLTVDMGPQFTGGVQSETTQAPAKGEDPADRAARLKRALLELKRAKLGVEQASLRQDQAERALAEAQANQLKFAREGIAAYKPYTDAVKALNDAKRQQSQVEADARRSVQDAIRTEREAHAETMRLRRQDIASFPQVKAALEARREAQQRVTDAIRNEKTAEGELARLRAQGIAGNMAVIAATEGLRDAHERLAEARRNAATAGSNEFDAIPAQINNTKEALDELTGAEKGFLDVLMQVGPMMQRVFGPATDAIFTALAGAFGRLVPAAEGLRPLFTNLGTVWANSIRQFTTSLLTPAWASAMGVFINGATEMSKQVGRIMIPLSQVLRDVAVAFMPYLIEAFKGVAAAMEGLAGGASLEKIRPVVKEIMEHVKLWWDFAVQLARVFLNFIKATAGDGKGIVKWLTEGAKALADWIGSEDGMANIKAFLRDMIPFAQALIGFVIEIGKVFFTAFRIVAPILTPIIELFNIFLSVVSSVLNFIGNLVGIFVKLLFAVTPLGKVFDGIKTAAEVLVFVFDSVSAAVAKLWDLVGAAVKKLLEPFKKAVNAIKKFLGVASPSRLFIQIGKDIVQGLINGIKALAGLPVSVIKTILRKMIAGIKAMYGAVKGAGRQFIQNLINGVKLLWQQAIGFGKKIATGFVNGLKAIGGMIKTALKPIIGIFKTVLNGVIKIVNKAIGMINKATPGKINLGPLGKLPGIPDIPKIPYLAQGGFATNPALAMIGEAGAEAVLPLTEGVFEKIGKGIQMAMATSKPPSPAAAGAGQKGAAMFAPMGRGGGDQHFHIPPSPAAHGQPDARVTASLLGKEMRKRR